MLARLGRALADYHHRTIHVPRVQRIVDALAEQIGQAESLLDVGCGDGTMAHSLAAAVGAQRVEGVDTAVRAAVAIEAVPYDGRRLPFASRSFEIVMLSDVLHHAERPDAVLRESLRVARRAVALKDHLCLGRLSRLVLLAMDRVGNAPTGVTVRGAYLSLPEWIELVGAAGGRLVSIRWPLRIHDLPWRLVTRSEHQFCALIEPLGSTLTPPTGGSNQQEARGGY